MQNLTLRFKEETEVPVTQGQCLWDNLRRFLLEKYPRHSVFVITDSNVNQYYSSRMETTLRDHPLFKGTLVVPAGENSKSMAQLSRLRDDLLQKKAGRDSVLIALGGGVVGDLAGFVAATLHRGLPLIQYPTSLLAQVDSSIGGKVGINHSAGKNLIGAFYQPAAIFTDVQCLSTLPDEEFFNGLAEVVKYACILDKELFSFLEKKSGDLLSRDLQALNQVISTCIQLKAVVVERDEKESRHRSVLNFGHTAGHALERLHDYKLKHGFAVAQGMQVAMRLSRNLLNSPSHLVRRLDTILQTFHLTLEPLNPDMTDSLWNLMLTDKKAREGLPRFTLLRDLAVPELLFPVGKEDLRRALAGD